MFNINKDRKNSDRDFLFSGNGRDTTTNNVRTIPQEYLKEAQKTVCDDQEENELISYGVYHVNVVLLNYLFVFSFMFNISKDKKNNDKNFVFRR